MSHTLNRTAPSKEAQIIAACREDFGRLAYDGFGIMLSDQQLEAREAIGAPGPRRKGEFKTNWLSGGTRAGKTVFGCLTHFDAGLYKRGVDRTDAVFWRNYAYGTLHIAPTDELALRLYAIGDSITKGSNEAQFDSRTRRARGGALLGKVSVGKDGRHGIFRYSTGAVTEFRSSEGNAFRLEGGQWWWCTWDEWASQPDREIGFVRKEVLLARLRDHDGKMMPMAWPKAETEHHLIEVIRDIEEGTDTDSQVVYLSAEAAYFTNQEALNVERRAKKDKDPAAWSRTILGKPAGGAAVEFKPYMLENMWNRALKPRAPRESGYAYLSTFDIGLAHDATVGFTFRIPIIGGKRIVTPEHKARVVNWTHLPGGPALTPDAITWEMVREQAMYQSQLASDATSMGGQMALRQVRDLHPRPLGFVSRSNDRHYGNMRLAAITNGLDILEWGRPEPATDPEGLIPWGLIESPYCVRLQDQMLWFDRDEDRPDDWVWAFLIGCWYIRRFYAAGVPGKRSSLPEPAVPFNVLDRRASDAAIVRRRRGTFISPESPVRIDEGIVYIKNGGRWVPGRDG